MEEKNDAEIKVCMMIRPLLLKKVKAIASKKNILYKDEINQALFEKVKEYENTHGPIEIMDY